MQFDCYPGSGIHQNLGTGCGIFSPVCWEFGQLYFLMANVKQPGGCTVVPPIKAKQSRNQSVYGERNDCVTNH